MTSPEAEAWHRDNDAYLGHALNWLRLRLVRAAGPGTDVALTEPTATESTPPAASSVPAPIVLESGPVVARHRWWRRAAGAPGTPPPLPTLAPPAPPHERAPLVLPAAPHASITEDDVAAAAAAMDEAAAAMSSPPALVQIAERLGLSAFERHALLLCAAVELDTSIPGLCAAVQGSPAPTFALALTLFDDPTWDVVSPDRPLRYWHLVEISQTGHQPFTTSPLRADERIVNALKGLDYLDDRLSPLLDVTAPPAAPPPPSQRAVVDATVRHLTAARHARPPLLELVGPDRMARLAVAASVAAEVGLPLYRLPVEVLPTAPAELDLVARLLQREALLSAVTVYIDTQDLEDRSPTHAALTAFLQRARVLLFLGGRDVRADLPVPSLLIDVARPTAAEQQAMWNEALGGEGESAGEGAAGEPPADVARLVAQFDVDRDTIRLIADDVQAEVAVDESSERSLTDRLWDHCRQHSRPRLEALAQRLDAKATWDQLVLPENELALLRQIADQVMSRSRVYEEWGFGERMNRGLGISALFAGESGTGKTMAAEVLANALSLDLYRIDLSSVVSKYIGETEKNLRRLFDAAEHGGVILFFDEADALFGKRSEVKDAHDRYANIEISYLLQRMEAYRGLAILATNMKSALDKAFTRRLRFIVNFAFPTAADRTRMWALVFPAGSPVTDLDIRRLARLNLTGAGIQNAALNAAFLAAHAGGSIGMREVLEAARNELRKLERPINEADFRVDEPVPAS